MPEGAAFFIHLPRYTLRLPRSRRSLMEMHLENNEDVHPKLDGWWNDKTQMREMFSRQQRIPFLFLLHTYWLLKACWWVSNRTLLYWTFNILSAQSVFTLRSMQKCNVLFAHSQRSKNWVWYDGHFTPSTKIILVTLWYNELATCFVYTAIVSNVCLDFNDLVTLECELMLVSTS